MIDSFDGPYRFLSNFYDCPVHYDQLLFHSAEAAFQAAKESNPDLRRGFCMLTPAVAKREGRKVNLGPDWEMVKIPIMMEVVHAKFVQNPDLRALLLDTGDADLVEGNWWHDEFWGVCNGHGQNWLGKILMAERAYWRFLAVIALKAV